MTVVNVSAEDHQTIAQIERQRCIHELLKGRLEFFDGTHQDMITWAVDQIQDLGDGDTGEGDDYPNAENRHRTSLQKLRNQGDLMFMLLDAEQPLTVLHAAHEEMFARWRAVANAYHKLRIHVMERERVAPNPVKKNE